MRVVRRPTALAAVSELRTKMDEILAQLKETPVSLERHGKPIAVLVSPEWFEAVDQALEGAFDRRIAKEVRRRSKFKGRWVPLAEIERRFL
jgi:PHD/YefM family antitoxin component YafN of YafNO toxin-antitoxin module